MDTTALLERIRSLPSFVLGSMRQTAATLTPRRQYNGQATREVVVLVPGAFCTAGVMDGLAQRLHARGHNVALPGDFPYWVGPLANTCPLEQSAEQLIHDVLRLKREGRGDRFWLVGHSNGGLISLLALDLAVEVGHPEFTSLVAGVVTMATPFRGTDVAAPLAPVIPACRDIHPEASVLARVDRQRAHLKLALMARDDFLVPPNQQAPLGVRPVRMEGFQHMDFLVGSPERVEETARLIDEVIDGHDA
jgi:pimeloyl-ACP methyl ester carboxylesterase